VTTHYKKAFFIFSVCLSVGLGLHGWHTLKPDYSWSTKVYATIQLFTLESGNPEEDPLPLTFELARYLAPLTTASGIFLGMSQFILLRTRQTKVRNLSDHFIIVGGNERALALARDLSASGQQVLVVLTMEGSVVAESCWNEGFYAVEVSESAHNLPEVVRVAQASRVIVFTEDDYTNLKLALLMRQAAGSNPLPVLLNLDDEQLCNTVQNQYESIAVCNYYRCVSRVLLNQYPLEFSGQQKFATQKTRDIRLIITHWDLLSRAFLYQVAKVAHYANCQKTKVYVVCKGVELVQQLIHAAYPNIDKCLDLHFLESQDPELTPNVVIQLLHSFPDEALTSILFLADSPEDSFSGSVRIKDQFKKHDNLRILLPQSPLSGSLEDRQLCVLPDSAVFCNAQMLLQDSIDHLAARVHQTWYEETKERIAQCLDRGDTPQAERYQNSPYFKPWIALRNEQKEENRGAADHLAIKLRALGMAQKEPAGMDPAQVDAAAAKLDGKQLEALAEMEHRRWAAVKWMTGWILGERDDKAKTHPNLVDYEALDEPTKQYDRDQISGTGNMLRALAASSKKINDK
jgi:hypothetical protein